MKIIKDISASQKTIRDISSPQKEINPDGIAKSLGAEKTGISLDKKQGPVSLFFLRQFFIDRLQSTGGRPALVGSKRRRNKIPLFTKDWIKLKKIAKLYKEKQGINVSPGQIASALIHEDILRMEL